MRRLSGSLMLFLLIALSCGKGGNQEEVSVSVSTTTLNAPFTQSTQRFDITSDGDWTLTVQSEDGIAISWAKPDRQQGSGNAEISVRVYPNEFRDERVALMTVTASSGAKESVMLRQAGDPDSDKVQGQVMLRIGSFNLRGDWCADKDEWAWENRKPRLVRAIKDCDFDIFGVNEYGLKTIAYFKEELGDIYDMVTFSPYAQSGVGDRTMGFLYKKSLSLIERHNLWYWMGWEDPTVYKDGDRQNFCVAKFVHKDTGINFVIAVTHGIKDHDDKAAFAPFYVEIGEKYNPTELPAFLVGDLNTRSDEPLDTYAVSVWNQYWTDSYLTAETCEGAYTTFNGFNMSRNMYTHPSRIDYIFYHNAKPIRYVNPCKLYDGYYASDHVPIYCEMLLQAVKE